MIWTMSKAHAECLYPYRPGVPVVERPPGKAARAGSILHKLAECHVTKRDVSHEDVDPHDLAEAMGLFSGPFRGWLDSRSWDLVEVGLRYDAENDTTERGPRRGDEGYESVSPMVLPGTLDLVRVADGAAWVVDIKSGQKANAHPEQLYAQAVAVTRLLGLDRAFVGFVFARKTKCDEPAWEPLDADRLDAEAGKIRRKLRMIPTAEPNPGDGCAYCPARPACPAHAAPPLGLEDLDAMAAF